MSENKNYAPALIRLGLGLLFIIPGLAKLANPQMIIGMLTGLGIPAPALMGWVVLLSEILFGAAVLAGWKLQKTVWPLVLVLVVALFMVHVPNWIAAAPMAMPIALFHILGIAALVSLYFSGAGAVAVKQG
jgi:putative oxidoreductase